jgi:hypothetical protein
MAVGLESWHDVTLLDLVVKIYHAAHPACAQWEGVTLCCGSWQPYLKSRQDYSFTFCTTVIQHNSYCGLRFLLRHAPVCWTRIRVSCDANLVLTGTQQLEVASQKERKKEKRKNDWILSERKDISTCIGIWVLFLQNLVDSGKVGSLSWLDM